MAGTQPPRGMHCHRRRAYAAPARGRHRPGDKTASGQVGPRTKLARGGSAALALTIACAALLLAAAGCGGSGRPPATSPDVGRYQREADAICTRAAAATGPVTARVRAAGATASLRDVRR